LHEAIWPSSCASIPQLKNLSFDIIADGHTGFTTNAHEKLLKFLAR